MDQVCEPAVLWMRRVCCGGGSRRGQGTETALSPGAVCVGYWKASGVQPCRYREIHVGQGEHQGEVSQTRGGTGRGSLGEVQNVPESLVLDID